MKNHDLFLKILDFIKLHLNHDQKIRNTGSFLSNFEKRVCLLCAHNIFSKNIF